MYTDLRLRPTWAPRRALASSIPRIRRAAKSHSNVQKRQPISSPQSKPRFARSRAEDWGVLLPGAPYVLPVLHRDERPERVKYTRRITSAIRGWRQWATESEMQDLPAELWEARISAQRAFPSTPEQLNIGQRAVEQWRNIPKVTSDASQSRGAHEKAPGNSRSWLSWTRSGSFSFGKALSCCRECARKARFAQRRLRPTPAGGASETLPTISPLLKTRSSL